MFWDWGHKLSRIILEIRILIYVRWKIKILKYKDIYKRNYLFRYFEKDTHTDLMNADLQHPNGLLEGIGSILEGLLGGLGKTY